MPQAFPRKRPAQLRIASPACGWPRLTCGRDQSVSLDAGQVVRWTSWHRWTAICLLAYIYLAVAAAIQREADSGLDTGLIVLPSPNCCGCCATWSSRHPGETGPTA